MNTKNENILVLITAQQQSKQFIAWGYDMAKACAGQLYVLHIADSPQTSDMEQIQTLAEYVCSLGGQFSFLWDCEPVCAMQKFVEQNKITKILTEQVQAVQPKQTQAVSEKSTILTKRSLIA